MEQEKVEVGQRRVVTDNGIRKFFEITDTTNVFGKTYYIINFADGTANTVNKEDILKYSKIVQ